MTGSCGEGPVEPGKDSTVRILSECSNGIDLSCSANEDADDQVAYSMGLDFDSHAS